ncbi:MAG: DUF488 family protein [Bacteroidia bacterium]|nr:DUF488 family protein [Bacteroidia bacterium]
MTQVKTKRVYDPYSVEDGVRILVDGLWPRGIKKEKLKYDIWEKQLAPSTSLRQWFHQNKINNWEKFKSLYSQELQESDVVKNFAKNMTQYQVITLIYSTKDTEHNHVLVLKPFLENLLNT